MSGRNIALTGVPRGGTTLACRLLGECEQTVSLFEPMDVGSLDRHDRNLAISQVGEFYRAMRHDLAEKGTAISKHQHGTVPDNPFGTARHEDGKRSLQISLGEISVPRPSAGFTLVIKHNAAFCALLPELASHLETFAVVRNPLAVLASWNTVDLPVADGRIPAGERLDPQLAHALAMMTDRLARQRHVLGWFFSRFRSLLPAEQVLRYEDIVSSGGRLLRETVGLAGHEREDLQERNASGLYRGVSLGPLVEILLDEPADWAPWYSTEDILDVSRRLQGGGA